MKLTVIGAYGYTGKLICKALQEASFYFSVAGKNEEKLLELKSNFKSIEQSLIGDIQNPKFIEQLISESTHIINCAGPFTEESNLLLEAVAKNGVIYLDITGEIGFIKESRIRYHELAQQNNSLIIHGCAFESLIMELLVQSEFKNQHFKELNAYYLFNQKKVSPGTKITMKMAKFRDALKIENKHWAIFDFSKDKRFIEINNESFASVPYPLPETAFFYWKNRADRITSSLVVDKLEANFIGFSDVNQAELKPTLEQLKLTKKAGPSAEERSNQVCQLILEGISLDDKTTYASLQSHDMYGSTAKAIVLSLLRLNEQSKHISGVRSPAELFDGIEKETLADLDCLFTNPKIAIKPC